MDLPKKIFKIILNNNFGINFFDFRTTTNYTITNQINDIRIEWFRGNYYFVGLSPPTPKPTTTNDDLKKC